MPDTWDDLARSEYAKPEEPVSARASDLTKIGAPVAAFITAVLAAVGGWVADAPRGHTVIAVAVVVAVAVGGLLYVFAADFRSRAAVAVARLNNLSVHAKVEARANKEVKSAADAKVDRAEAVAAARVEAADRAIETADEARAAADARYAEATERIDAADDEVARLRAELGRKAPAPPSYLALRRVDVMAGGTRTRVYGIESAGGEVVRYLVRGTDGRLRWLTEAEVGAG
jgi:hypothetical protein